MKTEIKVIEIKQERFTREDSTTIPIDIEVLEKPYGKSIHQDEDTILIRSKNLREVALAICPELSQPELKAVKTAEEIEEILNLEYSHIDDGGNRVFYDGGVKRIIESISNQFSQPKEEQPEKISFWVEQSTKKDIEISELKSEVEKAKETIKLYRNMIDQQGAID